MIRLLTTSLPWLMMIAATSPDGSGDPLDWLRTSVPGEPGLDYPIFSSVQDTDFSCSGLVLGGYYADPAQQCQAYHVCLSDPSDNNSLYPVSFLCPNGTVFNQQVFVCDWWFNVDCSSSVGLYGGAEGAFGVSGVSGGSELQCPVPARDQCEGAVSNCWSPGQRDTDCPDNGLCCFDGCADTCVDGPTPPPPPPPSSTTTSTTTPPPPPSTTTPPYQPVEVETEETLTGYNYPVPEVPLELPKPSRPPPGLPTLYGPPPV